MSRTKIVEVKGRQILDSRGRPTVEAEVLLECGEVGQAAVPSGASVSRNEACELRDGDTAVYFGRGVSKAVTNIAGEIASTLHGRDVENQAGLDKALRELDGTPRFERLGANAILAISLAACRAAAAAKGQRLFRHIGTLAGIEFPTLPLPMVNILSGGLHAGRGMDVQDFLIVPLSATDYSSALHDIIKVRAAADEVMRRIGAPVLLADEGGLCPGCRSSDMALQLVVESIERAGLRPGHDVGIAIDVAATTLLTDTGTYNLLREGRIYDSAAMIEMMESWVARFPIVSIEDGLHDEDWENWPKLTEKLANLQVIGDDLFSTNPDRIRRGIQTGVANSVLIKLNQNGTVSGTLDAISEARAGGYATVISARSGETSDSFISDLAVGVAGGQIKIGSVRNSERLEKYNQLLRISEESRVEYAGRAVLAGRRPSALRAGDPRTSE